MKKILLSTLALISVAAFAQTETLYEFAPKPATAEVTTEQKPENQKVTYTTPAPDADILLADAETLIRNKLIQKYQIALDELITQLTSKLKTHSAEEQRKALAELKKRLQEKKTMITGQKNLDSDKKEMIYTLLDYLTTRVDGLIEQSAHTQTKTSQA